MRVIYHAFDMPYSRVMAQLVDLATQGYTHVQLSPNQVSRTTPPKSDPGAGDDAWWYRYQPVAFRVGNCYGTAEELRALTGAAHVVGLGVLADVCLNFMAELDGVSGKDWDAADAATQEAYWQRLDGAYPPFGRQHFKPRREGGRRAWYMGNLPALDMEHPDVQRVHFAYLRELVACGIDGFRVDCAQWMAPATMRRYYDFMCSIAPWSYLEVIERRDEARIAAYAAIGPCTDYRVADDLARVFRAGNRGWVTELRAALAGIAGGAPVGLGRPQGGTVTFAINHDTYHAAQSRLRVKITVKDAELATALLLLAGVGHPLVFCKTAMAACVRSAMATRKRVSGIPEVRATPSPHVCQLVYSEGVVVVNKHDRPVTVTLPGAGRVTVPGCDLVFCQTNWPHFDESDFPPLK